MDDLLNQIDLPQDLKKLSLNELEQLCDEIRQKLIEIVAANGGHLSSNLGVVELTVALHRVFNVPTDKIVWDVGHQAYTHKMLTGRRKQIGTIRKKGGLSGFPNRDESEYDAFISGHSSTSISVALGLANAKLLNHEEGHVVAVIGDGALSGGLAYEGLNNAGRFNKNFIVILNDNKMSISHNVGSMARYLAHIRTKPEYLKMKGNVEETLNHIPGIGVPMSRGLKKIKKVVRQALYGSTVFEDLGFIYYGPLDGHDLPGLMEVLESVKEINHPVLVHVVTSKGKGYAFAEKNPGVFHGISHFDIKTGETGGSGESFSDIFGAYLCELAEQDQRICAITAAMKMGTGLSGFRRKFSSRFFDVGIAEEHAITFAGGLAAGGSRPVCAIYSTFLQRGIDQIIHDLALQRLNVVLAIDRAGIVGEDGETHQGIFDVSLLSAIPNITIFSPCYFDELRTALHAAIYDSQGVCAVRYPRGGQMYRPDGFRSSCKAYDVYGDVLSDTVLITYGRLFSHACLAYEQLCENNVPVMILKLNQIRPLDENIFSIITKKKSAFFFEEGIQQGGIGEHVGNILMEKGYRGRYYLQAVNNQFVKHAKMEQSLKDLGLDYTGMVKRIMMEKKSD